MPGKRKIPLVALLLALAVGCADNPKPGTGNALLVIEPYRHAGTWVFDDRARGLQQEPFVAGIPGIIEKVTKDIPNAEDGFRLTFSDRPFPGYTHTLKKKEKSRESGGHWYVCPQYDMEGWLCPALYQYFEEAPETIYFKAEKK